MACEIACSVVPISAPKGFGLNLTWWPCLENSEDNARRGLDPHGVQKGQFLEWQSGDAWCNTRRLLGARRQRGANRVLPSWSKSVMIFQSPVPPPANDGAADQEKSI